MMVLILLHIFLIIENLIKSLVSPSYKYNAYSKNIHFISKVQVTSLHF